MVKKAEKANVKKFTNITDKTYSPMWDGSVWEIEAGETIMVESGIADTFASRLLMKIANEKYDGIMPPDEAVKLLKKVFGDKIEKKEEEEFQEDLQQKIKDEADAEAEAAIAEAKKDLKKSGNSTSIIKGKGPKDAETVTAAQKKAKAKADKKEAEAKAKLEADKKKDEVFEDEK